MESAPTRPPVGADACIGPRASTARPYAPPRRGRCLHRPTGEHCSPLQKIEKHLYIFPKRAYNKAIFIKIK